MNTIYDAIANVWTGYSFLVKLNVHQRKGGKHDRAGARKRLLINEALDVVMATERIIIKEENN
jgi:hypothetical protein